MKTLAVAVAIAFVAPLHAQLLAPELQPLAEKYKADVAAFDAQKASAMVRAQQPYVSALDGAEKTATSAGSLDAVAAITKEREALKAGTMRAALPVELPKALQAPRKTCLDAMARVRADLEARRKAIDAAYLRTLASLQAKAVGKPELAEQIAAEKKKLLANVDEVDPVAGRWNPSNTKIPIVLHSDGLASDRDRRGKWECLTLDVTPRKYQITWDSGSVDTLLLLKGGKELLGKNAQGHELRWIRMPPP